MHAVRKTLSEAGDKVEAAEKASIEAAATELETQSKGNDKAAMESKIKELTEVSSSLAQRMYEQQAAAGESAAQQPGGGGEEGVFDAEFEEVKDKK